MSLSGDWADILAGQSLGTTDALAAQNAAVDAQEQAITDQKLADGTIDQSQYDQIQQDYSAGYNVDTSAGIALQETGAAAAGAADAALHPINTLEAGAAAEGSWLGNIVAGISNAAKNLLGGFASNIPWWVWIVAALVLFVMLDGPAFVLPFLLGKNKRGK